MHAHAHLLPSQETQRQILAKDVFVSSQSGITFRLALEIVEIHTLRRYSMVLQCKHTWNHRNPLPLKDLHAHPDHHLPKAASGEAAGKAKSSSPYICVLQTTEIAKLGKDLFPWCNHSHHMGTDHFYCALGGGLEQQRLQIFVA